MEYEFKTALWIMFFLVLIILPIAMITKSTGTLVIKRDYYDKYLEANQELNKLKEAREIQCQPVQCREGATGIIWIVLGFVFGFTGLLFYNWQQKRLDKREQELKEREDKLAQKSTLLSQSAKKPIAK